MRTHLAGSSRVLIVGAGVIGLTTALCARRRGHDVIVLADRFAPHITSNVAGALWEWPPAVCGQHRDQVSLTRSKDWAARSYHIFSEMAGDPATGVHLRGANFYFRTPVEHDPDEHRKMVEVRERVKDFRHDERLIKANEVSPDAGLVDAYRHLAPMVDTDRYMEWLMGAALDAGCMVRTGRVTGRLADQEAQLREAYGIAAIVNCSGLGSVELADDDMTPLRGAVIHAYRDHRVTEAHCLSFDEAVEGQNMVFIVPRGRDRLVLGGLVEAGKWSTDLAMASYPPIAAMLRRCQEFLPVLRNIRLVEGNPVRVGLRPYRQRNVRLEWEPGTGIVHNTGHGGSGFTFSWGCAEEAVDLVDGLVA